MRRGLLRAFAAGAATMVAEVVVFVLVARWLGPAWAVLLVLVASLLGAVLLRREGGRAWRRFRATATTGQPPGGQVIDGLVGLLGALLLAVPGLLTGAVGALLLVPPVRRLAGRRSARWAQRRLSPAAAGDLFGPLRVRVRQGDPQPTQPDAGPTPTIEGEIIGSAERDRPPV